MSKKSDTDPFTEMFSKFGHDLKMPNVDVDKILSHHRKNFEALQKSASATAAGAQDILHKQREILQDTMNEIVDMTKNFRAGGGNPQEMMAKQADFARRSFETAVKNASEVAEIVKRSGSESIDVLKQRIRDSMEEIRDSYEKRK